MANQHHTDDDEYEGSPATVESGVTYMGMSETIGCGNDIEPGHTYCAACEQQQTREAQADTEHQRHARTAIATLTHELRNARHDIAAAEDSLRELREGCAWHVEYSDSGAGNDIAHFLTEADWALRAAAAFNDKAAQACRW